MHAHSCVHALNAVSILQHEVHKHGVIRLSDTQWALDQMPSRCLKALQQKAPSVPRVDALIATLEH
eukprot:16390-Heterococcus_DN1.PRE.1